MFREDTIIVIKVLHTTFSQLGIQETLCLQQLRTVDPDNISHTLRLLVSFDMCCLWSLIKFKNTS